MSPIRPEENRGAPPGTFRPGGVVFQAPVNGWGAMTVAADPEATSRRSAVSPDGGMVRRVMTGQELVQGGGHGGHVPRDGLPAVRPGCRPAIRSTRPVRRSGPGETAAGPRGAPRVQGVSFAAGRLQGFQEEDAETIDVVAGVGRPAGALLGAHAGTGNRRNSGWRGPTPSARPRQCRNRSSTGGSCRSSSRLPALMSRWTSPFS